jgi:hypothetical protein
MILLTNHLGSPTIDFFAKIDHHQSIIQQLLNKHQDL